MLWLGSSEEARVVWGGVCEDDAGVGVCVFGFMAEDLGCPEDGVQRGGRSAAQLFQLLPLFVF